MSRKILAIIIVVLLAVAAGIFIYKSGQFSDNNQLVGNDRDAHGCIGSAGYSWCEQKNRCLRVWEEKCE